MQHNLIKLVQENQLNRNLAKIKIGDTVRIAWLISQENNKERLQNFEGIIIAIKGTGITKSINVRKGTKDNGVERIFPLHSPLLKEITIKARATKIRKAKIYYIRKLNARSLKTKLKNEWL